MNFKIKITICLRKNLTKVKLQRKKLTKTTKKQTNKQTKKQTKKEKKRYPPNPTCFSERFFTCSLPVSILKLY